MKHSGAVDIRLSRGWVRCGRFRPLPVLPSQTPFQPSHRLAEADGCSATGFGGQGGGSVTAAGLVAGAGWWMVPPGCVPLLLTLFFTFVSWSPGGQDGDVLVMGNRAITSHSGSSRLGQVVVQGGGCAVVVD